MEKYNLIDDGWIQCLVDIKEKEIQDTLRELEYKKKRVVALKKLLLLGIKEITDSEYKGKT